MFDAELVALSCRDGRAVQDFAAVCRATLQGDVAAARKLHLVAFDLLEVGGDDVRSLPWGERTKLLRETFPAGDRLRIVQSSPASRAGHEQLVEIGFEGSVLKRPWSMYRPGRPPGAITRPVIAPPPDCAVSDPGVTATPTRSASSTAGR